MRGWRLEKPDQNEVASALNPASNTVVADVQELSPTTQVLHWVAPLSYLGDRVSRWIRFSFCVLSGQNLETACALCIIGIIIITKLILLLFILRICPNVLFSVIHIDLYWTLSILSCLNIIFHSSFIGLGLHKHTLQYHSELIVLLYFIGFLIVFPWLTMLYGIHINIWSIYLIDWLNIDSCFCS